MILQVSTHSHTLFHKQFQYKIQYINFYFPQRHEFPAIFDETVGYRLKLRELTDGGTYTCHYIQDQSNEFDIHFNVEIDRELKKLRGLVKIMNNNNNNKNNKSKSAIDVATAPIGVNQFLTTAAIHKPHLKLTAKSGDQRSGSSSETVVASNSMIRRTTTTGDGHSSIQKRHINSFDTDTDTSTVFIPLTTTATIITTSPPMSSTSTYSTAIPVLHSNKQQHHSTLYDLELTTATAADYQTTIVPLTADKSNTKRLPHSQGNVIIGDFFY